MRCNTSEQTVLLPKYKHSNTPTKSITDTFTTFTDARFIWTAWVSNIILLEKKNIQLHMCFKDGKQLHINNCLADKLFNMVINWSLTLGSYLCEKQLIYKKKL